jgi:hypothetical protein
MLEAWQGQRHNTGWASPSRRLAPLLQRAAWPDEDADPDALIGIWRSGFAGPGWSRSLTSRERYEFLVFRHGFTPLSSALSP